MDKGKGKEINKQEIVKYRIGKSFLLVVQLLIISSFFYQANSQQFGGNPSSVKWQQINTDTARVIFPEGLQETGNRVASIVHELNRNHSTSIGNRLRKINIVLQNQTTVPNAYVGLGPYRSEFYLTPPQNSFELGGMNWVDQLSLHEYRHVQQFSNFNVGFAKPFSWLFGQQGQALVNALTIPDYFFEGDAVFTETVLSKQGRGRVPYFFNGFQSLTHEKRNYSFMKLRNGSFKHYVPDHYELGYLLTGFGREKFGEDFWRKVSQDALRVPYLAYPWQSAIKKHSGLKYKQFVKEAFAFYNEKWLKAKAPSLNYITPVTSKVPVDYKYVYKDSTGDLIVLKRGFRTIPTFYRITTNGQEQRIGVRDIAYEDYFSYNNGHIVYASLNPDSRWGYREYSNIILMNAATGKRKTITKGERYFSPDISHEGTRVVAVDMRTNQSSALVIVDTEGKKLFRSGSKRGIIYTYPKFSSSDKDIYSFTRNEDGNMALLKVNVASGKETELLGYSNRIYSFPVVKGDTVIFSSSYKGSDEIWAYIDSKKEVYRVAYHPTGLYQAVIDDKNSRLITSNFTTNGYKLAAIPTGELLWQSVSDKEEALPNLYLPNALSQESNNTLKNIETRSFPVSKYRKTSGLFNFHSWRPLYDLQEFSFTVYGENVLNTFQNELSYTYNRNERSHRAGFTGIYGGWYLQPFAGISHTWNRTIRYNQDTSFNYNEFNLNAGVRLPLNLSGGRQYRFLTLSSSFNNQNVQWTGLGKSLLTSRNFNYLEGRITYTGQIQSALQHIYPRWAQTFTLQYRSAINKVTARQFLANAAVYLPGLHVNHNIVVSGAFQERDTMNQYVFTNSFPFSRGYTSINLPRMWRLGFNYHLPLFYPDFGIGNIVYFQRLRLNGFYDMTNGKSLRTGNTFLFNSTGGELFFDTKWWNQLPVTLGVRYTRILNVDLLGSASPNRWEVILPINLLD